MMIDRQYFIDNMDELTIWQERIFNAVVDEFERRELDDPRWVAYVVATIYHEHENCTMLLMVGSTKEKAIRNAFRQGIRFHPGEVGFNVWFIIDAMLNGRYTGKDLIDYFNGKQTNWIDARKIIGDLDSAESVAMYAYKIFSCLK